MSVCVGFRVSRCRSQVSVIDPRAWVDRVIERDDVPFEDKTTGRAHRRRRVRARPRAPSRAMASSASTTSSTSSGSDREARAGAAKRARRDAAVYGSFLDDFKTTRTDGDARDDDDDDDGPRSRAVGRVGMGARMTFVRDVGSGVAARARAAREGAATAGLGTASGGGLGFGGFARGKTMTDAEAKDDDESDGTSVSGGVEGESESEDDLLPSTFGQRWETGRATRDARAEIKASIGGVRGRLTMCGDVLGNRRLVAGAAERAKTAAEARAKAAAKREADAKAARARNTERGDVFAGTSARRDGGQRGKQADDVGSFEKHTKGIGMKLLEKMGYKKGEGLGKGASGISRALETQLRPKNMGMGFNNFKENVNDPTKTAPKGVEEAESDEEMDLGETARARDEAKRAREQSMWKKRHNLRRQKREYKTAEEILAEEDQKANDSSATRGATLDIIDMRGTHAQVVNAKELHKARVLRSGEVEMMLPELQHNLKLIVDLAESDITKLDGKIRTEKDTLEILRREKVRLSKQAEAHDALAKQTRSALELVQRCDELVKACKSGEDFDALTKAWTEVVKKFPKEYHGHRLHRLALAHAAPWVRSMYASWDPATEPTRGLNELKPWRALLTPDLVPDEYRGVFEDDSYENLLREPMLSRLRPFISSNWDPTKASEVLDFIEAWSSTMPKALTREITHSLVLPRLLRRVAEWEPTKERIALHSWFLPWLPHLHKNLKDVYPTIRQKFSVALTDWDASDESALTLLKPWRRVFEAKDWSSLMRRCITPKLEDKLAVLQINPSNQSLDPLKCVLKWERLLGSSAFMTLLEQHFFPKWHAALHKWLTAGGANLDEVAQWYIGWKSSFSEELLSHERVRVQLNVALNMMNQAAAGEGVVKPSVAAPQPAAEKRAPPRPSEEQTATLKEMIEEFANAHDLEFIPNVSGRRHDGLTVYSFGGVSVVVDAARESIRASVDGAWIPISLDQLLERARSLASRP